MDIASIREARDEVIRQVQDSEIEIADAERMLERLDDCEVEFYDSLANEPQQQQQDIDDCKPIRSAPKPRDLTGLYAGSDDTYLTRDGASHDVPDGWTWYAPPEKKCLVDLVTVLTTFDDRDYDEPTPANKEIRMDKGGKITKAAARMPAEYKAEVVEISDLERDMAVLLKDLDINSCLILGAPAWAEAGDRFTIKSQASMKGLCGLSYESAAPTGLFVSSAGMVTSRLQENFNYSTVRLIDRDPHDTMTKEEQACDGADWLTRIVEPIEKSLKGTGMLIVPSNSNRIVDASGKLVFPSGGYHYYVQLTQDSPPPDEWAHILKVRGITERGHIRHSHSKKTGEILAARYSPPWDHATMTGCQRIDFAGCPYIASAAHDAGVQVIEPEITVRVGGRWSTAQIPALTDAERDEYQRITGASFAGKAHHKRPDGTWSTGAETIDASLELDMEVETDKGWMTIAEYWDSDHKGLRAQAHWRGSASWNAKLGRHRDGTPYLFDNGADVKMVPSEKTKQLRLQKVAVQIYERGLAAITGGQQ